MICKICEIASAKVINAIEIQLAITKGMLTTSARKKIISEFPEFTKQIEAVDGKACELHYNFHQKIVRIPAMPSSITSPDEKKKTLAEDVGKDEAQVLYEMLNAQAATFNALTNQINEAITERTTEMTAMQIHPSTLQFYKEISDSMRATVREIRELNSSINGQEDLASKGLVALIDAIHGKKPKDIEKPADEMTTKEFDY